jgi:hypothetical protein
MVIILSIALKWCKYPFWCFFVKLRFNRNNIVLKCWSVPATQGAERMSDQLTNTQGRRQRGGGRANAPTPTPCRSHTRKTSYTKCTMFFCATFQSASNQEQWRPCSPRSYRQGRPLPKESKFPQSHARDCRKFFREKIP